MKFHTNIDILTLSKDKMANSKMLFTNVICLTNVLFLRYSTLNFLVRIPLPECAISQKPQICQANDLCEKTS